MTATGILPRTRRNKELARIRAVDAARGMSHAYVDVAPVSAHLQELMAVGFSLRAIASSVGVAPGTAQAALQGRSATMRGHIARRYLDLDARAVFEAADDVTLVPTFGVVRRVRALQRVGWRMSDIDDAARSLTGVEVYTGMITTQRQVEAARHRAIAAVFDAMATHRGSSVKTSAYATNRGWAPPLAWDDDALDDPAGVPSEGAERCNVDRVAAEQIVSGQAKADGFASGYVATVWASRAGVGARSGPGLVGISQRSWIRYVAAHRMAADPRHAESVADGYLAGIITPDANHATQVMHATIVHLSRQGLDPSQVRTRLKVDAGRAVPVAVVRDHVEAYRLACEPCHVEVVRDEA